MAQTTTQQTGIQSPPAGMWKLDPAHTIVGFVARHLMVTKVRGRFASFDGTLHIDEVPELSHAEVTIEASSIDTGTPDRDAHLRSPDFLDVERYPTLRFRSAGTEITGDNAFRLKGDLTIRDVTRPVVLDVQYEGTTADPWGGTRAGFTASTEIDREDWGLTWNVALEAGGVVVGRKVKIEIEVEAVLAAGEHVA